MKTKVKDLIFFFFPLLILNIISLLNMYNARLISETYNNAFFKQLIWFIIGYLIIFLGRKIKIKKLFKYSLYFYLFTIFLLILVLFVGSNINGAKCWLKIFSFSFQPSELTKLSLLLLLINISNKAKLNSFKDEFLTLLLLFLVTLIPSILVFLEPDTGAIINYVIILFIIICFLKINKWWYITFGILFFSVIATFFIMYFNYQDTLIKLIGTSFFYRMDRLINFASGSSYQLENALINIGASSLFGVGLGKILLYIPEAPTDFFFAFSTGNFGIISSITIIASFFIIDAFLMYNGSNLKNKNYKMFIYSYLGIFIFHQIYNIAMNLGLVPIMGIPLPFLSYGGTNTLINYLFLSIILNLCHEKKKLVIC